MLYVPNATINYTNKLDKEILQNKAEQVFWEEVQDYKDRSERKNGSGLQVIKFDFDRLSRDQNCYSGEILNLQVIIFPFQLIFLAGFFLAKMIITCKHKWIYKNASENESCDS